MSRWPKDFRLRAQKLKLANMDLTCRSSVKRHDELRPWLESGPQTHTADAEKDRRRPCGVTTASISSYQHPFWPVTLRFVCEGVFISVFSPKAQSKDHSAAILLWYNWIKVLCSFSFLKLSCLPACEQWQLRFSRRSDHNNVSLKSIPPANYSPPSLLIELTNSREWSFLCYLIPQPTMCVRDATYIIHTICLCNCWSTMEFVQLSW